jgi:hypothetical protein
MNSKTKSFLAALTFGLISFPAWAQPAAVRFDSGHGESFWITNNTDKTLCFTLNNIEVLAGSKWKAYSQPHEPTPNYYGPRGSGLLYFTHYRSTVGRLSSQNNFGWLSPHEAGYGHLMGERIELPGYGVWRANVTVSEQLTGQDRLAAAAKYDADIKSCTNQTIIQNCTNILSSTAAANIFPRYWGHPQVVYSEEVQSL